MSNAKLTIIIGGEPERQVVLSGGVSIGRAPDNSVHLPVEGVSRYHAIIEQRQDGFWLSDLNSRNGTTVNGAKLEEDRKLEDKDSIVLGEMAKLEFHANGVHPLPRTSGPEPISASDAKDVLGETKPLASNTLASNAGADSMRAMPAVLIGVVILAVVAGVFVIARLVSSPPEVNSANEQPPRQSGANTNSRARDDNTGDQPRTPTREDSAAPALSEAPAGAAENREPGLFEINAMAQRLASQISERSGHTFESEFIVQIKHATLEFRSDFISDARLYGRDIKAAFNARGLSPIFGLVLAMSQSRFKSGSGGIWHLPGPLARNLGYLKPDENESTLGDAKRSSEIAAQYLKQLQEQFGGKENFMYAVACYGEAIDKASSMGAELDAQDPSRKARLDFWRMVQSKVVSREEANRVTRFLAAGIVSLNPERFGIQSDHIDSLVNN